MPLAMISIELLPMPFKAPNPPTTLTSTQASTAPLAMPATDLWMVGLIIGLPFLAVVSILGHRRYKKVCHQRRIAYLERVWRLTISNREKK